MLQRLEVKNFLALRDIALNLEPLTVIVGANATGKSTILEVLDRLSALKLSDGRVLFQGRNYQRFKEDFSPRTVFNQQSNSDFFSFGYTLDGRLESLKISQNTMQNWVVSPSDGTQYGLNPFSYIVLGYSFPNTLLIQANFSSLSLASISALPKPFLEKTGAGLATI